MLAWKADCLLSQRTQRTERIRKINYYSQRDLLRRNLLNKNEMAQHVAHVPCARAWIKAHNDTIKVIMDDSDIPSQSHEIKGDMSLPG